jgi:hypothetical protein
VFEIENQTPSLATNKQKIFSHKEAQKAQNEIRFLNKIFCAFCASLWLI